MNEQSGQYSQKGRSKPGDEATGRSRNLSFEEAFTDAVKNLPPLDPSHPDALDVVVVTEIRGEFGGIAGFHDLVVKIRRSNTSVEPQRDEES
jgi:hypothetical protein